MRPKNISKENRRFIQGAMIINAPSASLNLGQDGIKKVSTKGEDGNMIRFSYLSGQFIKSKIKETLEERGEELSKPQIIQVPNKEDTPTTSCDPFQFIDDDLFGYMNVIDTGNHPNRGTTRVAPFKISYFLGKEGDISKDFAIKQRGKEENGKIVQMKPHVLDDNNRLFASTSYSGCFSIDVNLAGRFFKGETAGFHNIAECFPVDNYSDRILFQDEFEIVLIPEIRKKRLQTLINSFPYIYGGARLSTVYSDLSPKFVVYCVTDSGNHLFQEIASIYEHFNVKALIEAVTDFKYSIKSDIYIALKNGFLDNKRKEILDEVTKYNKNIKEDEHTFIYNEDLSGIRDITLKFTDKVIPNLFEIKNI